MPSIEIYTDPFCPYCRRAKALLTAKGVAFAEIDVMAEPARRREMSARAGGRTSVPQIFVDGRALGGSDDIQALDRAGQLDAILGLGPAGGGA
jgi:glutaredoxin 3